LEIGSRDYIMLLHDLIHADDLTSRAKHLKMAELAGTSPVMWAVWR